MDITIHTDGFEGFVKRSKARAHKMDRGERIKPSRGITFESPLEMFEVLTVQRLRLIEVTRTKAYSITALAKELKRDPKSVRRDVAKLEQYGVIRTSEEINPGHGRVKMVEASSGKFRLQIAF